MKDKLRDALIAHVEAKGDDEPVGVPEMLLLAEHPKADKELQEIVDLTQQTVGNLAALGISEADAMKAIEPLRQEIAGRWLHNALDHAEKQSGAVATSEKYEYRNYVYQTLADMVCSDHPTWTSKSRVAREVYSLIVKAGHDGSEHFENTIRQRIKLPS